MISQSRGSVSSKAWEIARDFREVKRALVASGISSLEYAARYLLPILGETWEILTW